MIHQYQRKKKLKRHKTSVVPSFLAEDNGKMLQNEPSLGLFFLLFSAIKVGHKMLRLNKMRFLLLIGIIHTGFPFSHAQFIFHKKAGQDDLVDLLIHVHLTTSWL